MFVYAECQAACECLQFMNVACRLGQPSCVASMNSSSNTAACVQCFACNVLQMFDAGCCSPLLKHLLSSGQLSVKGKKTFVPGCG